MSAFRPACVTGLTGTVVVAVAMTTINLVKSVDLLKQPDLHESKSLWQEKRLGNRGESALELCLQPKLVGREEELRQLESYLDKAKEGHGSTVFISGEAGIGKTRLVDELKRIARSRGFQVLSGCCMFESLTPYMPFYEALKSSGLEHLFAEEAPKVEAVYLVTHGGLMVTHVVRKETKLSPDLFPSMLTTVGDFVKDSLSTFSGGERRGALNMLGYENYRILIEAGRSANLVVILTGKENEFLIDDMKVALLEVDKSYGNTLLEWDGEKEVAGVEKLLQPFIASGKYDGIYYGKDDPKAKRNLLFENVSLGLVRQAQMKPILLCMEDLQWADPSSLSLTHYVSRTSRDCSLLILGTYRPEDVIVMDEKGHPLVDTMHLMNMEDLYSKIELKRLPEECLSEMLSSMIGHAAFDDELKKRIYRETEGNPLFIVQLVKFLVEENLVSREGDVWKPARSLEKIDIPAKVYSVISRRLERVEKEHRKALDYASVIGETFKSATLAKALGLERVPLLEQLRSLERTHKLVCSLNGTYKFDHAKVKEVLYTEIPPELKMEYHSIVANSIEELYGDKLDEAVGDLAFQYYHCRNKEKAPIYLAKAAEKARKAYSNEEAIRFYNEALEFEGNQSKKMKIYESLGGVYALIGEYDKSIRSYDNALELAQEEKKIADIKVKKGSVYEKQGEYDKTALVCGEALQLVENSGCEEEAAALRNIGLAYFDKSGYDIALGYFEKALAVARRIEDYDCVAECLNKVGAVYLYKGEYEKALGNCVECYDMKDKVGSQDVIARSAGNIGLISFVRGDYDKAEEHIRASSNWYEKVGNQAGVALSYNNLCAVLVDKGEFDRALEYQMRSLEISKKIGDQWLTATSLCNIGSILTEKGELDTALDYQWRSLEILKRIGDKRVMTDVFYGIGDIYRKKKDYRKSLEYCEQSFKLSSEIGVRSELAASRRLFGTIYKELNEWAKASENFEEGIRIFTEDGDQKEAADSHYEFGLMWKEKGNATLAKQHFDVALKIYDELGLKKIAEPVRAALRTLDG